MNITHIPGYKIKDYLSNCNNMEVDYSRFSSGLYKGFEGFSPIDLIWNECQFIITTDNDKNIIGVLKFKRYKYKKHQYLTEEEFNSYKTGTKNYKGILFIDVREDFRRQGIARRMIKYFCDITNKESLKTSVRIGFLTHLGKQAKLLEIFKEYLPNREVII